MLDLTTAMNATTTQPLPFFERRHQATILGRLRAIAQSQSRRTSKICEDNSFFNGFVGTSDDPYHSAPQKISRAIRKVRYKYPENVPEEHRKKREQLHGYCSHISATDGPLKMSYAVSKTTSKTTPSSSTSDHGTFSATVLRQAAHFRMVASPRDRDPSIKHRSDKCNAPIDAPI